MAGSRRCSTPPCPSSRSSCRRARSIPRALFPEADADRSSRSAMAAASIWRSRRRGTPRPAISAARCLPAASARWCRPSRPSGSRNIRLFTDDALKLLVQAARCLARRGLPALSRSLAQDAPPQAALRFADDAGRTGAGDPARRRVPFRHRYRGLCQLDAGPYRAGAGVPLRAGAAGRAGTSPIRAGSRRATSRRRAARAA